ncbi:MAG: peptidase M75 superfamily protein [Flavobacteriaceae bacterium]|nr:peptidase M75 superfamily protein [Flavobacteriaceae bacterium]
MILKKIFITLLFVTTLYACSKSDDINPEENQDNFDRAEMLVNWADNIIVPSYNDFNLTTVNLISFTAAFNETTTQENLEMLRTVYKEAYLSFQNVALFEIGPAETVRFYDRLNTYPTNISEIEGLIAAGATDLSLPSTNDAQGFPAIDYMLYGVGENDVEILEFYTTHPNAEKNKAFLMALVSNINGLISNVSENWTAGYRDDFVNNNGSSAAASVDKLTNDFVFYYEKHLRAGKIGIPAGIFSNNPLPNTVEALYAKDFSKALALEALNATERFFKGQSFNTSETGPSYAGYLNFLNTIKNGEDLSSIITAQFSIAKNQLNTLDTNFINQINTNNSAMLQTYDELQRNVILLKVDMMQALSINVDYVDADGD